MLNAYAVRLTKCRAVENMIHKIGHNSMVEIAVPIGALYGAKTQRAVQNFGFSGRVIAAKFLRSLSLIKAAALANE